MKLVYCPKCQDAFKLDYKIRTCKCGASKGIYKDSINAIIFGDSIPFCIGWSSFCKAIKNRPVDKFEGESFSAWIPPINSDSIIHERNKDVSKKYSKIPETHIR